MASLARAIEIAASAHREQRRFDGTPYVLHPLRLMFRVTGESTMIAAVLHDIVEDTHWSLEQLSAEGFSAEVLKAVDLLTHKTDDPYDAYIDRIAANDIARQVKIADLEDNSNLLAIPDLSERDLERARKYHEQWKRLKAAE